MDHRGAVLLAPQRGTRHASATLTAAPQQPPHGDQSPVGTVFDGAAIEEMQRAWGVEGRPFTWTVADATATTAGSRGTVEVPDIESPAAALLDAAVHVARLADADNAALLLPAGAESLAESDDAAAGTATIEVFRRSGDGPVLVVDAQVTGPDGTVWVDVRGLTFAPVESAPAPAANENVAAATEFIDWSTMSAKDTVETLRVRLRAILARELGMPEAAVDVDSAFPELGLDSMMAMNLLRDAKALVRIDLSATMLWNHPSIAQLSQFVAELLAPTQQAAPEPEEEPEEADDSDDSDEFSLDDLFDSIESSVESANAGSEGTI